MKQLSKLAALFLVCIVVLSSCSSVPDHAKYIPKDASVVVALNVKEIGKTLTWSTLKGSKLLDDLKKGSGSDTGTSMLSNIENSGIDWLNTAYFYAKPDKRYSSDSKMGLIVPMSDEKDFEAFLKKMDPNVVITKTKAGQGAMLGNDAYAIWNGDVIMVMNTVTNAIQHEEPMTMPGFSDDTAAVTEAPADMPTYKWTERVTDTAATLAEAENSFDLPKDASVISVDKFKKLSGEKNDIAVYVAYDAMMNSMAAAGNMSYSIMASPGLWKDAVMTTGINFRDGKITADALYYPSDSLKKFCEEAGKENVDKEMLARISGEKLNMALGYHLSLDAIKSMLERFGMLNIVNEQLVPMGTNVEEIMSAFTGDLTMSINEFGIVKTVVQPDSALVAMYGEEAMQPREDMKPNLNMVIALKVKNKAVVDKLLAMLMSRNGMPAGVNGNYSIPMSGTDTATVLLNDNYLIASNKSAKAQAFTTGKGSMPEVVNSEIAGHPTGIYLDIKGTLGAIDPQMMMGMGPVLTEVRNILSDLRMNGGEFKGGASVFHAELNFVNKSENSLIQLLNLAQRMNNPAPAMSAGI